jgi:hypothetical protein
VRNSTIGRALLASAILALIAGLFLYTNRSKPDNTVVIALPPSQTPDSAASERSSHRPDTSAAEKEPSDPPGAETEEAEGLPREKVEEYLTRNKRSAASLLAAFHALDNTNYLNEAAANFPNDPQLQWTILTRDAFPQERRQWLDRFKASSPDNSLANYLSAADHFRTGRGTLPSRNSWKPPAKTIQGLCDGGQAG